MSEQTETSAIEVAEDPIEWAISFVAEIALQPSEFTTFYGTFGWGQEHKGRYVKIHAPNETAARLWMADQFIQKWCTTYPQERYDDAIAPYNYELLVEVTVDEDGKPVASEGIQNV